MKTAHTPPTQHDPEEIDRIQRDVLRAFKYAAPGDDLQYHHGMEQEQSMKVEIGDTVHVKGRVLDISGSGALRVGFEFASAALWVIPSRIVHVESRPLKVKDVMENEGGTLVTVVAINEDVGQVVLQYPGGSFNIYRIVDVKDWQRVA